MASDGGDLLYMNVAGAFGILPYFTSSIELFTKQRGIISNAINDIVSVRWKYGFATEGGLVFYNRAENEVSSSILTDCRMTKIDCVNFG